MDSLKRDYSIDILKCLAAVIITWSHFELPLGKYSILATGGSFGDCLFFSVLVTLYFLQKNLMGSLTGIKNV